MQVTIVGLIFPHQQKKNAPSACGDSAACGT